MRFSRRRLRNQLKPITPTPIVTKAAMVTMRLVWVAKGSKPAICRSGPKYQMQRLRIETAAAMAGLAPPSRPIKRIIPIMSHVLPDQDDFDAAVGGATLGG